MLQKKDDIESAKRAKLIAFMHKKDINTKIIFE